MDSTTLLPNPSDKDTPFVCVSLSAVAKMIPPSYLQWQLQCEALLEGYDLFRYPNGSYPQPPEFLYTTDSPPVQSKNPAFITWMRQDRLIYGALFASLSPAVGSLVTRTRTSAELWTLLKKTYGTASRGHIKQLKDRLRNTTMGSLSVTEYMHTLKSTADMLASIGSPVNQEDLTDIVLRGLDDNYKSVIDAVNARDDPISFEALLERLIHRELAITAAARHLPPPATALVAQSRHQHRGKTRTFTSSNIWLPREVPMVWNKGARFARLFCIQETISPGCCSYAEQFFSAARKYGVFWHVLHPVFAR